MDSMTLHPPKIIKSTLVHDGFCRLKCDTLQTADGQSHAYYTVTTKPQAALVIGTTREGQLLLLEEYRHSVGRVLLGPSGGFVNKGETPEQAARRELMEETGHSAESFRLIGTSFPLPGLLDQQVYFFHAQNVYKSGATQLDATEALQPVFMTLTELKAALASGRSVDSALCAALFFLQN